jgi:hypothetical protein
VLWRAEVQYSRCFYMVNCRNCCPCASVNPSFLMTAAVPYDSSELPGTAAGCRLSEMSGTGKLSMHLAVTTCPRSSFKAHNAELVVMFEVACSCSCCPWQDTLRQPDSISSALCLLAKLLKL